MNCQWAVVITDSGEPEEVVAPFVSKTDANSWIEEDIDIHGSPRGDYHVCRYTVAE